MGLFLWIKDDAYETCTRVHVFLVILCLVFGTLIKGFYTIF